MFRPFRPEPQQFIEIEGMRYKFTEHPSAKGMPYGQTGRRATVYQLQTDTGSDYALKVFTGSFRTERVEKDSSNLSTFKDLPGLQVCNQMVISQNRHKSLVEEYPDLNYSIMMPWINGQTWQEIVLSKAPFSPRQSFNIAKAFLQILQVMEQNQIAHCDLSGPNVLLPGLYGNHIPETGMPVELVDVEDLFAPNLIQPEKLPGGSPGYAHNNAPSGLWGPAADRYAGVVLLAEMLAWCDPGIRQLASGEQFFDPEEMQQDHEKYQRLREVLSTRYSTGVAYLFSTAWFSESLDNCPSFTTWQKIFSNIKINLEETEAVPASPARENFANFQPILKLLDTDSPPAGGYGKNPGEEISFNFEKNADVETNSNGFQPSSARIPPVGSLSADSGGISFGRMFPDDSPSKPPHTSYLETGLDIPGELNPKPIQETAPAWTAWAMGILALVAVILGYFVMRYSNHLKDTENRLFLANSTLSVQSQYLTTMEAQADEMQALDGSYQDARDTISNLEEELNENRVVKVVLINQFHENQYIVINNRMAVYLQSGESYSWYTKPGTYRFYICHVNDLDMNGSGCNGPVAEEVTPAGYTFTIYDD